jgi:hypothetical protein
MTQNNLNVPFVGIYPPFTRPVINFQIALDRLKQPIAEQSKRLLQKSQVSKRPQTLYFPIVVKTAVLPVIFVTNFLTNICRQSYI